MSLAHLPDDALELVLRALFAPRRRRAQTLCLDDTVFVALVSRRMNDLVRRVFAELVSAFSDVVGISKPSGRVVLMTNRESIFDAKPGAEGRRFKFVLEWQRPKTIVASARCAYTSRLPQIIKDVLYCPAYQQGLRYTGHAPPVRNSNLWNPGWQAYRASFCSKTLSNWAIKQLVRRSPINMIVASCDHCFDQVMEFTPTERVTSLLLMSAAYYGRVDVLERLFRQHLDRSTTEFYGIARLLFFESDVALEDGHLHSGRPYYMEFFVLPAVLGNRVDVLKWVRAATTELFKRQWPQLTRTNIARGGACGTEFWLVTQYETLPYAVDYPHSAPLSRDTQMRALSGRQPFGPEWHRSRDFACAAILATQCGSVKVLEWMYNDISCDSMFGYAAEREQQERRAAYGDIAMARVIASREEHMQTVRLALAVCALNGGNFKRGNVRNDKPYRKLGASARWGLSKWRSYTKEGNLGDLCNFLVTGKDSAPDGLTFNEMRGPRCPLRQACANINSGRRIPEPSELSLLSLLQKWTTQHSEYAYTDPGSTRTRMDAVFHSVFSFGDEDHTRWIIEETRPGGFLAAHPYRPDDRTVMNATMPFAASLMHSPVACSVFERTSSPVLVQRHAAFFMLTEMGGNGLHRYYSAKGHSGVHSILDVYTHPSNPNTPDIFGALRDTSEATPLKRFGSVDALECSFEYNALMTAYTLQPGPESPWPLGREPPCDINRSFGLMLAARLEAAWECATNPVGAAYDYEGMLLEADAILQIYVALNKRYTRDVAHPVTRAAAAVRSELAEHAGDAGGAPSEPWLAKLDSILAQISTEAEPSR